MSFPRFLPMLPESQRVGDDVSFVHEIKWDGFRTLAYLSEEGVRLESRNGRSFNQRFAPIVKHLEAWKPGVILDGEVVAFNLQGRADFSLLRYSPDPSSQLCYVVFDLLFRQGVSICPEPWSRRRACLEQFFDSNVESGGVMLSPLLPGTVEECLDFAKQNHLEGIVSKRKDSPYLPGTRSPLWCKQKLVKTADCVVVALSYGGKRIRSLGVAIYAQWGELYYLGKVGSGLGHTELDFLYHAVKLLENDQIPVVNPPTDYSQLVWLRPHLVVELEYLEITPQGRLRHPVFKRFRFDKEPLSCKLGVEEK